MFELRTSLTRTFYGLRVGVTRSLAKLPPLIDVHPLL